MPTYDFLCKSPDCALEVVDIIQSMHAPIPPCPVCGGEMEKAYLSHKAHVISDSIRGGMWLENYGPKPIQVFSHTEIRRLHKQPHTDKEGNTYYLSPMVRHVGVPGSDKSPHTTRWVTMDPVTMENARLLVERVSKQGRRVDDEPEPGDSSYRDPSVKEFNETYDKDTMLEFMEKVRGDDGS